MSDQRDLEPAPPADLTTLAEAINAEHRACETALKAGLAHAVKAGDLLIEARARCSHGAWLPWLSANFEGSERLAQAYMRVARAAPALTEGYPQRVADISLREALAALAASKPPADGEYAAAVQQAAGLVVAIADSWWTVAEILYELTTGDDPAQLADVCAAISRASEGVMTPEEGAIRRATWIAYGDMPAEQRPFPDDAASAVRRLGGAA